MLVVMTDTDIEVIPQEGYVGPTCQFTGQVFRYASHLPVAFSFGRQCQYRGFLPLKKVDEEADSR